MNNWIPSKKYLTIAMLVFVTSTMIYVAGLFLVNWEIRKIEKTYNNTESDAARYGRAKEINAVAAANEEQIKILKEFFVDKENQVGFIEQIENTAKDSKIKFSIESINSVPDKTESVKEDLIVQIIIEGEWLDLVRFVDSVEKMPFGVLIQKISLEYKSKGEWSGRLEIVAYKEK